MYTDYLLQLRTENDFYRTISEPAHVTAGFPVGIIAVDLDYPKLPGNVVNASTFSFPVLYEKVSFEIEALFRGDPAITDQVVDAAGKLEAEGVRVIFGACGFFAHFQEQVKEAVHVPVFLSSLCQLPMIRTGLRAGQKTAVIAASGESITPALLAQVGAAPEGCVVFDVGSWESFAPIRWGRTILDNGKLAADLAALGCRIRQEHPEIGAILLECSDLPPYAWVIQQASRLPVYDFITLIKWAENAMVQQMYRGLF